MLKAVFAMAFVLLTFNSAYAERISIGQLAYRVNNEAITYFAIIIDHSLDIANKCAARHYPGRPTPVEVVCVKLKYHSQLPAGANTTSVFMPLLPSAVSVAGVWEADQNSGAVQFCVFAIPDPLDPCTLAHLQR
jgi:hypothetical protein